MSDPSSSAAPKESLARRLSRLGSSGYIKVQDTIEEPAARKAGPDPAVAAEAPQ